MSMPRTSLLMFITANPLQDKKLRCTKDILSMFDRRLFWWNSIMCANNQPNRKILQLYNSDILLRVNPIHSNLVLPSMKILCNLCPSVTEPFM